MDKIKPEPSPKDGNQLHANESILSAVGLSKVFNPGAHNEVDAVVDVRLSVEAGSAILIKGPSGSGKTTLLTMLGCLAKPTTGKVICLGETVSHWSEKFLTCFRRRHIGVVFQNFNLISGLTVFENIALPLLPEGPPYLVLKERVKQLASEARIDHRLYFKVDTLSGGEMQRTAIARALVNKPKILIADEPTAHIDSKLAEEILSLFQSLKQKGLTILIASHDPLLETHPMIERVFCMRDGRLRYDHAE